MSKIGILGGTFDPIHYGHLYMAHEAKKQMGLDTIIFVPSGTVPHKNNKVITDRMHRYNMVCCAANKYENYMVSDTEINRDGVCYTFETLKEFSIKYKGDQLYFIIGADCVFDIDRWKNPGEIFKHATVLVINRNSDTCFNIKALCDEVQEKYNGKIILLDGNGPDISSTMIRDAVRAGQDIGDLLPECVFQYIEKFDLYKED